MTGICIALGQEHIPAHEKQDDCVLWMELVDVPTRQGSVTISETVQDPTDERGTLSPEPVASFDVDSHWADTDSITSITYPAHFEAGSVVRLDAEDGE